MVATYLAEHPEFLVAASETLHQRQQIAQQQAYVHPALQYRAEGSVVGSPSVGPNEAKAGGGDVLGLPVLVVVQQNGQVENLIQRTRYPVYFQRVSYFSSRWPVSDWRPESANRYGLPVA